MVIFLHILFGMVIFFKYVHFCLGTTFLWSIFEPCQIQNPAIMNSFLTLFKIVEFWIWHSLKYEHFKRFLHISDRSFWMICKNFCILLYTLLKVTGHISKLHQWPYSEVFASNPKGGLLLTQGFCAKRKFFPLRIAHWRRKVSSCFCQ